MADKAGRRPVHPGLSQEPASAPPGSRRSEARERILATADRLFYSEGIRAVGVTRVVKEAEVTRVTFYHHFPSKDDLVVAYLRGRAQQGELGISSVVDTTPDPYAALQALGALVANETLAAECRGCPFINAAAEYGDPDHPVRAVARDHRAWVRATTESLLRACGHPEPTHTAETLLILRTGAVVGSSLDSSDAIAHVFLAAWNEAIKIPHLPKKKR